MSNTLRNVLAVIAGLLLGGSVNMAIIIFGGQIIPPPEGVDVTSVESLRANIHLFEARHFITPFVAHAAGALIGGFTAAMIGVSHRLILALIVAAGFFLGGLINAFWLPAPVWFAVCDLALAYLPMGWLGFKLSRKE